MTELSDDFAIAQTLALLTRYAFDLKGYMVKDLIALWLDSYHASWLRLATIEALYLGRYKAVSVEQILSVWLRLGSPNYHFNHDFERLICRNLPRYLTELSAFSQHKFAENEEIEIPKTESNQAIDLFSPSSSTNASLKPEETNLSEMISLAEESPEIFAEIDRQKTEMQMQQIKETKATKNHKQQNSEVFSSPSPQLPNTDRQLPIVNCDRSDYEALLNKARRVSKQTPIHQFVPPQDSSAFYSRLKVFVRKSLEESQ